MVDEVPSGEKAVYIFLEMIALGFVLAAVETLVAGRPLYVSILCLAAGIVFLVAGIKWPQIRAKLGAKWTATITRIANDYRYRWGMVLLLLGLVGIYGIVYLHALRSDLDFYIMQRTVSKEQAEKLREYLSQHEAYAVSVRVVQHDPEAMEYAARLFNAMLQTNWDINPPNHDGPGYIRFPMTTKKPNPNDVDVAGQPLYRNNEDYLNARDAWLEMEISYKFAEQINDNNGLCIEVEIPGQPTNPDPKHPTPDTILGNAMRYAGIEVNCNGGAADRGKYSMYLLVGHRPRYGDREPITSKISEKIGRWIKNLGQ